METSFLENFTVSGFLFDMLRYLGMVLFYTWPLLALFLLFSYWQNKRKRGWVEGHDSVLLQIKVPRENEKTPLAAEMMFSALHGIFKEKKRRFFEGSVQDHVSFEIASFANHIGFYCWAPSHLKDFVEGQIYAQYPEAEITQIQDYTDVKVSSESQIATTELTLTGADYLPIKTFKDFEVDPLAAITGTISKLQEVHDPSREGERVFMQLLVKPETDNWKSRGEAFVEGVRDGKSSGLSLSPGGMLKGAGSFIGGVLETAVANPAENKPAAPVRLTSAQETQIKAFEEKAAKLGFGVKLRIISVGKDEVTAAAKLHTVIGAFKQFTTSFNGLSAGAIKFGSTGLKEYQNRYFRDSGFVLTTEELASLFHLPNISVATPTILWTGSKKGEPPSNLPIGGRREGDNFTIFGTTNFRNQKIKFGIKEDDRRRHMYLIGKTGVGKTTALENMIIADVAAGKGLAVVDPHGDLVDKILDFIPASRINDVIVFDPSDRNFPIAFNPLESVDPDQRGLVVSGMISIFQKLWAYTWGPRLEHILRNTLLALLEYEGSTIMGVTRMLVDNKFRAKVRKKITDVEVKRFWQQEFPLLEQNERLKTEAISPILNKVGQFLSTSTMRNILGQPKSAINLREVMDQGKILLIRLPQGAIGEDNTALLGAMIITKLQLAAMSRVDIPEEERKDFYLYVDEFQNFATESFAKILSEARKYRLNLIIANQYIEQLVDGKNTKVKDAVFGNVGTLASFRVGAGDAEYLATELDPFTEADLVNLDKYNIYLKLAIDGITSPAFSAMTLAPPKDRQGHKEKIVSQSQERYAKPRDFVEEKITQWMNVEDEGDGEEDGPAGAKPSSHGSKLASEQKESNKEYDQYLKALDTNSEEKGKESEPLKDKEETRKPVVDRREEKGEQAATESQKQEQPKTATIKLDNAVSEILEDIQKEKDEKVIKLVGDERKGNATFQKNDKESDIKESTPQHKQVEDKLSSGELKAGEEIRLKR